MSNLKCAGSDLRVTMEFFQKAFPEPTNKTFHTQLGVHFEEVAEMIDSLRSYNPGMQYYLTKAHNAVHDLSEFLKQNDNMILIDDRKNFLKELCDQIVTAAGVGYQADMDMPKALSAVNRSNLSKFDNEGNPILDENKKVVKGPNYKPVDLEPYI